MPDLKITNIDGGVAFPVKAVPASSRTAIAGLLGNSLKIKLAAPPEKGKANQCLIDFLAKKLIVKPGDITIVAGKTAAAKIVQVKGITEQQLKSGLQL